MKKYPIIFLLTIPFLTLSLNVFAADDDIYLECGNWTDKNGSPSFFETDNDEVHVDRASLTGTINWHSYKKTTLIEVKVRFTEDEIILIQQLSDGELVDAYIINRYDLSVTKSDGYWSGQCELKET
jgi:hypothetical protein